MVCSNFHIHHCLLKDKNEIRIKTFPYLPTLKLKNNVLKPYVNLHLHELDNH